LPQVVIGKPCKTLFVNTPQIPKTYKGIRKKKRENLKDVKFWGNIIAPSGWLHTG
jgi:hypothetical protein